MSFNNYAYIFTLINQHPIERLQNKPLMTKHSLLCIK